MHNFHVRQTLQIGSKVPPVAIALSQAVSWTAKKY